MSKPDLAIERCERDCIEIVARRGETNSVAEQLEGALAIGPDRWLVFIGRDEATALFDRLSDALAGKAAVIDQSSAYVTFRVSGISARAALARLCRLDLHPKAFARHQAARTLMAQVPVILYRMDDVSGGEPCFALHIPITLAKSFGEHLVIAARSFGVTSISDERQYP